MHSPTDVFISGTKSFSVLFITIQYAVFRKSFRTQVWSKILDIVYILLDLGVLEIAIRCFIECFMYIYIYIYYIY